ncbi:MAG: 3-isopropylmalate dehydratase large subunit [Candidatus Rokuibacteriota bacterium]|nr:MAG: 3-isopropylmalate dehydratase large subunit [Candidatus Rokubacteria bacterium]
MARTMFEKIWARHVVAEGPGGQTLLYIDRHLLHEGSTAAFVRLARTGRRVRRPDLCVATADHYVLTSPGAPAPDAEIRDMVQSLGDNTARQGIVYFGQGDARRGIVHVIGPEQGLTLPGMVLVCGDSHTATHGALGALAFGIGSSEVEHVLATQTLWQRKPKTMRITVDGRLGAGVSAKDVILAIIARISAAGGVGHALEYAGAVFGAMSMAERLTVCNMSIEAGARCGMVAPDETTYAYIKGRPFAPDGEAWERAVAYWKTLPSDAGAAFDREVRVDGAQLAPTVTWGTSPQDALPITGRVPDPAATADAGRRASLERALAYMGLSAGMALTDVTVDRVFIGSCTNSRLEDLRAAAAVAKGRRAVVPAWIVPGSGLVKEAAEREGLDRIFREAGFEWREAGCSMCVGMNGETARERERVASTSNRNFEGRQGKGARTHLMSPAMAAAAAVTGRLTDVRQL